MAPARRSLADRLWEKIAVGSRDECWLWTAATADGGYGKIGEGGRYGRTLAAHRVVYELEFGPVPVGHEIDHLCEVKACCNPAHLEAVTHHDNLLRGTGQRTHCRYGHPLDGLMRPYNEGRMGHALHRYCLTCNRERARRRRAGEYTRSTERAT